MILLIALCGCDVFDASLRDPPVPAGGAGGSGSAGGGSGGGGGQGGAAAMDGSVSTGGMNSGGVGGSGGMGGGGGTGGEPAMDGSVIESGVSDSGLDASLDANDGAMTLPEAEVDLCPEDPSKLEPGECGCGGDEALAATCSTLRAALRHRYSFEGTGVSAIDSVSAANGEVMNATLDDSGALTLAGGTSNDHVVLPPDIVSALTNATFETWLRWDGSAAWERIFDFGTTATASSGSYIFLTPRATSASGRLRAAISTSGANNEVQVEAAASLEAGVLHNVAVVVDDDADQLHLYVDGVLQDSAALSIALASIDDATNWLGRSHYSVDPELTGTLYEVRIYAAALTGAQLGSSFQLGPDPPFLE